MKSFNLEKDYKEPEKRSVNVSMKSFVTIDMDKMLFSNNEKPLSSTIFYNTLLENYSSCFKEVDKERIPFPNFEEEYKKEYNSVISCFPKGTNATLEFKENYKNQFVLKNRKIYANVEKGAQSNFRLRKANLEFLLSRHGKIEEEIFQSPTTYLNAFFDRYGKMQYVDREWLYYYDKIKIINEIIDLKEAVNIEIRNKKNKIVPLSICTDSENNYNYLVGLIIGKNTVSPQSIRISAITDVSPYGEDRPEGIDNDLKTLKKNLLKGGPIFLTEKNQLIKVELTNDGKKMYERQLHLRPVLDHIEKENIYCFNCSTSQILYYFFKYGKEAKIIEPQSLADSFMDRYKKAVNRYT